MAKSRCQPELSASAIGLATLICIAMPSFLLADTTTFAKDIVPILQAKCQECHRSGSMAPMSLITYEEVRPYAKAIRDRVSSRQMPPWHIDQGVGVKKFKNDMSLSDQQIETIARWVDQGAPAGNPQDAPPERKWPTDNAWQAKAILGEPDLVITAAPYTMPAHHQDVWWRPLSDVSISEPRWVRAVEVHPATLKGRRIIHHATAYLVQDDPPPPGSSANDSDDTERRGLLMEWAVGKQYDIFRKNSGRLLLPGSKLSWDIHIHAVGEEITESVQLALWFYPKGQEPKYRTYLIPFLAAKSRQIDLPPNTVGMHQGFTVLPQAAMLENFQPHMHWRGRAMALEAILPDGAVEMVSFVDRFNFNWMTNYIYADDVAPVFPKGTVIHVTAWHDNTTANKNNPDPDQWVGYGDRTVDEMAHAWVNVTYISDADYARVVAERKQVALSTSTQK